ncbi:MAG: GNAT family N-acetyltransferase [Myxococcaceae bacterium]|nr:GNAT family N-acetyltransferase [Myxococcaceae bacterium]
MRVVHVTADALGPWVPQLRALEAGISYPIDDGRDRFELSHGGGYHGFFSKMGEAHFLLALEGDALLGCVAAVRKPVRVGGAEVPAVYLADLKVAPAARGRGVPARLLFRALSVWARSPRRLSWRFAFGAAMRGARGDVMRAAKGVTPMKLASAVARLHVYFERPEVLAALKVTGAPPPPAGAGLDLSPEASTEVVSTAGLKDFVLASTGAPWPLVHLPRGPSGWGASHAAALARGGRALVQQGAPGPACFALDDRLEAERHFLEAQGVRPGAVCTVYGLSMTRRMATVPWVHLATSDI